MLMLANMVGKEGCVCVVRKEGGVGRAEEGRSEESEAKKKKKREVKKVVDGGQTEGPQGGTL